MVSSVEFIIGLAIGTGLVSIYYYLRLRKGGAHAERFRKRFQQARLIFGVSAVLAVLGEILIRI